MFSLKKSVTALVGLLVLVVTLVALVPLVSRGQGNSGNHPPPFDVNVVNTPLPVTGTVTVGNLGDSPLPVRDVDNPARQPVQARANCSVTIETGCLPTIYTVPAGKRLVIEYASMDANVPAGELAQLAIATRTGGETVEHAFPLTPPSVAFSAGRAANVGQQVRLYADPGTSVVVTGSRSGFGSPASFIFTISGHLVDVP